MRLLSAALLLAASLLGVATAFSVPAHAGAADVFARRVEKMQKIETKENFVNDMAKYVSGLLDDQGTSYADKQSTMRKGLSSLIDMNWIAKFVLGKSWNTATEEQRERYTQLYRDYLMQTYMSKFTTTMEKSIQGVKVLAVHDAEDGTFTASTEMLRNGAPAIKVDYLLKETAGEYKAIDIAIEGISLLNTHRSEFSKLASEHGVDGVIAKLEESVSADASAGRKL